VIDLKKENIHHWTFYCESEDTMVAVHLTQEEYSIKKVTQPSPKEEKVLKQEKHGGES